MVFLRTSNRHTTIRTALREPAMQLTVGLLALLLAAQGAFWYHTRAIKPEMGIVPAVPGERTVRALSFGDEETFFRLHALNIQNSGDTFGRFTALYKYDFNKLYHWFRLLDGLDNESNYLPAMASYYFSQTQNGRDVRYLVDYLDEYTEGRPKEKWWWVVQASYLAQHKLNDTTRALQLAERLSGLRGIPIWAQQLPAFLHEERGEFGEALAIIEDILKHPDDFTQGELNFMKYFVDERLNRLTDVENQLKEIQKEKDEMKAKGIPEPAIIGPPPNVGAPTMRD
ncbi:MAG: hypothetical protein V4735_05130 [Pseudomonadota bacterium]